VSIRDILPVVGTWYRRSAAKPEDIDRAQYYFGVWFPEEYREFLLWSNGGECVFVNGMVSMWSAEELAELNHGYRIQQNIPRLVAIGSDGGSTCYALDYADSTQQPAVVQVDFSDLDASEVINCGPNLEACFRHLSGLDAARGRLLRCFGTRLGAVKIPYP
jgi:hypothetical protein